MTQNLKQISERLSNLEKEVVRLRGLIPTFAYHLTSTGTPYVITTLTSSSTSNKKKTKKKKNGKKNL